MQIRLTILFFLITLKVLTQNKVTFLKSPDWVKSNKYDYNLTLAISEINNGSYYLFYDEQYNLVNHTSFFHYAYKIVSNDGVQGNSELVFNYNPVFEKFNFIEITLIRDGKRINYKNSVKINVVQREDNLENYQIDASLSVIVIFKDIRIGDIIEYSYLKQGINPIFNNKEYLKLYFNSEIKQLHLSYRVIYDTLQNFTFKYQNTKFEPTNIKTRASLKEIEWDYLNVKKVDIEDNCPTFNLPYSFIEISQYQSWEEVEKWAFILFNQKYNPSKELEEKLKNLLIDKHIQEEKIIQLIRFVQNEIRYFGIEIGVNSHLPQTANVTFNRRFGDCKDKSILLCFLLNSIGVKAYPVLINTNNTYYLEQHLPAPHQFNHVIVSFLYLDKTYFVDATSSNQGGDIEHNYCPNYKEGIVVDNLFFGIDQIKNQNQSAISTIEEYKVKSYLDTNVTLQVKSEYVGDEADNIRSYFSSTSIDNIHTTYLEFYNTYYNSLRLADTIRFTDDSVNNIFTVYEKYSVGDFWKRNENVTKYKASFTANNILKFTKPYNSLKNIRKSPLLLSFPIHYKQKIIIDLWESWSINNTNDRVQNSYLNFSFNQKADGNKIILDWELQTFKNIVDTLEYPQFVKEIDRIYNSTGYEISHSTDANKSLQAQGDDKLNWWMIIYAILLIPISFFSLKRIFNKHSSPNLYTNDLEPLKIGGWLILPIFGLFIFVLKSLWNLFNNENSNSYFSQNYWDTFATGVYQAWTPMLFFEVAFAIFMITCAIYLLVLCFKYDRRFPVFIIYFYSANILYQIIEIILGILLLELDSENIYSKEKLLIQTIVGAAIWIPYFLRSERVKITFIK